MSADPDQKVYFRLSVTVPIYVLAKIETFLLDGATGNVQLNIRDGEILGVHLNEIVAARVPCQKRRQTA